MRLLHPRTIKILASHPEFPKTHLAHCWSECFKYLASGQKHPKMFIDNDIDFGMYLGYLYYEAGTFGWKSSAGCKLDGEKIKKLRKPIIDAFDKMFDYLISYRDTGESNHLDGFLNKYFDDNYLFSDACSLYFKGINIFPDIFGDQWRKYVPVESLKEIKRQVDKTLSK